MFSRRIRSKNNTVTLIRFWRS